LGSTRGQIHSILQERQQLLDGFYGKLGEEPSGAEADSSFVPPKPAVVDRPCPRCGGPTAVLLERGQLVLACRTCPDPEGRPGRPRGRP